jgi:hypothetical protein
VTAVGQNDDAFPAGWEATRLYSRDDSVRHPMVREFLNILSGKEGLFLATLTGRGHVALQSMAILNLAEEIGRYLPGRTETSTVTTAGPAGAIGGLLGGLFGNPNVS